MNSWSDTPSVPTLSLGSIAFFGMIGHLRQCGSMPERALTVALPLQSGFSGMHHCPSDEIFIPGNDSQLQALRLPPRPVKPHLMRSISPASPFPKNALQPLSGRGHAGGRIPVFDSQLDASVIVFPLQLLPGAAVDASIACSATT